MEKIKRLLCKKAGFTIIELIVSLCISTIICVAIIGILPMVGHQFAIGSGISAARLIGYSIADGIEGELKYARNIEVKDNNVTYKNPFGGKCTLILEKDGIIDEIEGVTYDKKYFMNNTLEIKFEDKPDKENRTLKFELEIKKGGLDSLFQTKKTVKILNPFPSPDPAPAP